MRRRQIQMCLSLIELVLLLIDKSLLWEGRTDLLSTTAALHNFFFFSFFFPAKHVGKLLTLWAIPH